MKTYKKEIVWRNIAKFSILHMIALIGLTQVPKASLKTLIFGFVTFLISALVSYNLMYTK